MGPSPRQARAGIPSFETSLQNEEEVLDAIVVALSKNALDPGIWLELHEAAVRFERVSELAFAYEAYAQGRKLKTFVPAVQAELFFRAATFFADVLSDELGATSYLERALATFPGHAGAFSRIDAQLSQTNEHKKLAELIVQTAPHRPRAEQIELLRRAVDLFEAAGVDDKAIEILQQLVRLDPGDEGLRDALEARFLNANRYRDLARMFEQALAAMEPTPPPEEAARVRGKLIDVFANHLKEPERAMPHVEALLEADPFHAEARRVAVRLLESKGLAARAAAALSPGATTTEERAQYLAIELEHTRGPRRRDVLRRIGVLKQDELGDDTGAFEAFEQALALDPSDDELRQRHMGLGIQLKGPLEVAKTFARVSTVAKDAAVRSRITAEIGDLLLRGGDLKRAKTTLAGVLGGPSGDPHAVLTAARALASVYESEGDAKSLVEVLEKVGELSPLDGERQLANERIAEICTESGATERAIGAWRRLVDSPARARALEALEPLYEQREQWIDLSFVLEERSKDTQDPNDARALAFRAAEVLTSLAKDTASASEAWRRLIATYGPARDALAQWIPILEHERAWPDLAQALASDADLAPDDERPLVLARLGNVYLQRTREPAAAIAAFKGALDLDPNEKTSRATLEKLLLGGDQRLAAAAVLEPIYRGESNAAGLLRVLDIRASSSPDLAERLAALSEAADVAEPGSPDKALEMLARGLGESVANGQPLGEWMERFNRVGAASNAKRRAALLVHALGGHPIDSPELLSLAVLVGEETYGAGDVAASLAAYRAALAFEPSSPDLIAKVDQLLQEQGNPEERVALYRAALERGPDPVRRRQLLHSIGTIERFELMNPEAAIAAYRAAVQDDPSDREAHGALVGLYTETEAWAELCDLLEDYLAHAGSADEARSARAQLAAVATAHGQGARGAAHAGALLDDPEIAGPELDLIEQVATTLGDAALLTRLLERRVHDSADPAEQVRCLDRLAVLAQEGGDTGRAIERLRQAADVAGGMGDEPAAIGFFDRIRALAPNDEHATAQLVELHERAGSWDKVPPLYAVLLELATDTASRVGLLGRLARTLADRLGDEPRAFAAARSAFELAPDDGDVLSDAAELAIRTGQTTELAEAIDQALAGATNARAELLLAKARLLASRQDTWGLAAAAFREVLAHGTSAATVESAAEALSTLLRSMPPGEERTRDVRWLCSWRVDQAPAEQRTRALFAWAEAEEHDLAEPQRALELYKQVLALDEADVDALAAVSRLSLAQGDVEGALGALMARRAASDGAARNALDVQIATILASRPARAAEALDRIAGVLESTPQDGAAIELAARLLARSGDAAIAERAARVLERSLDAIDDAEQKTKVLDQLIAVAPRRDLYERYLDTLAELGRPEDGYHVALRAVRDLPAEQTLWDRAEQLARDTSSAEPLADTYEAVLAATDALDKSTAIELGQRAVAFFEEWYEDSERVVRVLERLLQIEPEDTWAFDRLKLIFDSNERWDDLFALYDRAASTADKDRKFELLEEAAQIAKDFAKNDQRAIRYFEQLLELKPGNARLSSALERLYERNGWHRELITLRGMRVMSLPHEEAQRERARIATLWLDELNDASSAIIVIEDIVANQSPGDPPIDVTTLLERVLAAAPRTADIRESIPPPPAGRRDSYVPMAPKRGLVRQRAAALLRERYSVPGKEADLARVLEVELEVVKSVKERIRRHQQIAALHTQLGNDDAALEHVVQLVLLEPEVAAHRQELATIAARVGRFDRLADVLVSAADDSQDDALKVELLMSAGAVTAEKMGDLDRAIELFFRILAITPVAEEALLEACRHVEPLLDRRGRSADRLDVLERLAKLEREPDVRWHVLGEAARLAMTLDGDDRAIWAWERRLEVKPGDPEALDGLAFLFEKSERWQPLIDALMKRAERGDRDQEQRRADRVRVAEIQGEKLGAVEDAIATWRAVEEAFGSSDDGTRALAALYRATQRWPDLAALLEGAAARATNDGDRAETLRELGDVQREQLDAVPLAIASYERSLAANPRTEGSRKGLRSLLGRPDHRVDVVRVLLAAYVAADEWQLILELTEHRLDAAADAAAQIAILMESARISEQRAGDSEAAFALVRRALLLDPSQDATVGEIFRLAEATRAWRLLADALRECIEGHDDLAWARALRFRMGQVLETRLDEPRAALDAYVHVHTREPASLEAAASVIRVAGRTARWDAAARAVLEATRATSEVPPALLGAVEEAAQAASGWDAVTFALASLVADGGLTPVLARDLEAAVAVWHRDRRGDPDAAESAYTRALAYDPTSSTLLAELAQLQRRARGRPLVDSLLRLSQTTGGDLDLLAEAAETAVNSVGDRALAKSIFDRLLKLASDRWLGTTQPNAFATGSTQTPEHYVDLAVRELVRIHGDDGDHDKVVELLTEAAQLPWSPHKSRALRHDAAVVAVDKLGAADRAIAIYLGLIDEDPQDSDAVARLVALYEAGGLGQQLLELKRRLVTSSRETHERLALRLEIAELEGRLDAPPEGAIGVLHDNLAESPRHAATVAMLASLLDRQQRVADLEKLLAEQARLGEEAGERTASADFYWRAADVAERKMGDLARAIGHLRRLVALEERTDAYDALARLSTATKAYDDAASFLDRLRELTDGAERAAVTLRLADALVSANRKAEARERLEAEIQRDPDADSVRIRLAETYRAGGDWRALAELLTEGAQHAPDKATRLARLREAAELHRSRTGEPERAIPLLEQAADLAPDENAVKLALADALGAASRFDEARALLRTLIDAFGGRRPKERAPVHYHLARLDLAVGDRARALVELDAATRIDPANPEILRALAELARDDGQLERAERSYRALLTVLRRQEDATADAAITRSEVMFELSQIALRQGEPDRSKEILESAFELAIESTVEARRLEGALRRGGDHPNLARALAARLERGGADDEAALRTELGMLYDQHLGRRDEALEMILRALDLEPDNAPAHEAAFRLASTTGKMAAYEARIRSLAGKVAHDGDLAGLLYLRLARIAETDRQDDLEAAQLYEQAALARPRDRELLSALATVYERLGDDAGQARVLAMRVELDRESGGASADALYRLATLHFKSGDVEAACDAFEQAFELDPDLDRAEELLRTAADAHPEAARIVDIYERLAREPGRERSLVDALVRRWTLPGAGTDPIKEAVTVAEEKLEDKALAESLLRRFLERERPASMSEAEHLDGRVWALALLAWRCEESGRFREAAVLKREAAEIAEPDAARRFLFEVAGLASGPLEDLRLASSIYEELLEKEPQDRDAWELLLDVYRRLDDFSKLVSLIERVVEYVDDVAERSRLRLERVRVSMDKLKLSDDDASRQLREIVDDDPAQVDAALLLVTLYERNGREEDLAELLSRQLDGAKDRQDAEGIASLSLRLGGLLEKRDRAQARDVYYSALEWAPQTRELLLVLERLHDEDFDIDARSDVMERRLAIESDAEAETLAISLHDARMSLEDRAGALRALELGFRRAPRSTQLKGRLEAVYREANDFAKLAELYTIDARGRLDAKEKAARLRDAAQILRDSLGNAAEAARILREAREADPSDALLLVELVDTLSAAGELPAAVAELTAAIDGLDPSDPIRPDLVGRRALFRSHLDEMDGALADFEDAIGAGKQELRVYLADHLGKMAIHASDQGDLATWRAHRLRIAGLRLEVGDIDEARNVLNELLKSDSKDKATLRAVAHLDELEERWDAASATYRRLVGLEDADGIVSAAMKLLETCEKAGRLADARGGLERARMAAPEDAALRERLAWLYEQLGALKELAELVLEDARAAGDVGPRFEGLFRAGALFLEASSNPDATQQMDTTAAIAPLEEAHALRPNDLDCAALLSDAYVTGGRFDEAQDLLLRTIGTFKGRRARELSALYHRLARLAEILGDRNAELQHLTTALDMDAQNGVVASELAYLALELGNLEVAQRALRQITMLKTAAPLPRPLAYQYLGEIARQQGDNRRAMMLLKRAIDEDPSLDAARALLEQLQSEG